MIAPIRRAAAACIPRLEALVVIALFVVTLRPIFDPDTFLHMATGRIVLSGSIPSVDPFSHTIHGKEWLAHEWLAAAGLELLHRAGGLPAVVLVNAVAGALAVLAILGIYAQAGVTSTFARAVSLAVAARFLIGSVHARPHMVTMVFLPLGLILLTRHGRTGSRWPLLALPSLFAIWANCHGGFILGAIPFLVAGVDAAVRCVEGAPDAARRARDLGLCAAACVLACTLNPHGVDLLFFPLQFRPGMRYLQTILEWEPLAFHNDVLLWTLLAAFVVAFIRWQRASLGELAGLMASLFLLLQARRSIFLFAIFGTPILCRCLERAVAEGGFPARLDALAARWPGRLVPPIALLIAALAAWPWCRDRDFVMPDYFPRAAAAWLKTSPIPGRMFNGYNQGGYLIWALGGTHKVFIDGRIDTYRRHDRWQSYVTISSVLPGWERLLDEFGITFVVEHATAPIVLALHKHPAWAVVFMQDGFVVLVRASLLR
jgi:hypothetical protein